MDGRFTRKTVADFGVSGDVSAWPEGVPLNEHTLRQARKTHAIYWEGTYLPVEPDEDAADWYPTTRRLDGSSRRIFADPLLLDKCRDLAILNPYCKRALKLYMMYVFGSDFVPYLDPRDPSMPREDRMKFQLAARQVWDDLLEHNSQGWSPAEHGKRAWRDGDALTRVFDEGDHLRLRFIDPEYLKHPEHPEWYGIQTDPRDACVPLAYWITYDTGNPVSASPWDVYHTKLDADAVEPRGYSRFTPVTRTSRMLESFLITEATHRQAQASIVMIRKVAGGQSSAQFLLDNSRTSVKTLQGTDISREKYRPGSYFTVPRGVDIEFAQPRGDFSNASPLANMMIRQISIATGWPFSMLSADTSEGTLASEIATESPVGQMIEDERREFGSVMRSLFKRAVAKAIQTRQFGVSVEEKELWTLFKPCIQYGMYSQRDRLKHVQSLNLAVMNGGISRREFSRQLGVDADQMREELADELESGLYQATGTQMPTTADRSASSQDNANKGGGTNQGGNTPAEHKDRIVG